MPTPSLQKKIATLLAGLLWLGMGPLSSREVRAQEETEGPQTLVVGVIHAPPSYVRSSGGQWEGIAPEIWQAVARRIDVSYRFQEFEDMEALLEAFENRRVDVIPALPVLKREASRMEFSHAYLKSGLAIAIPREGVAHQWGRIFGSLFSADSLNAIAFLLVMSLLAGSIVWRLERRTNTAMFGGETATGIGQGLWWAVVTMATVGYGDKAPRTIGGRCVAFVWMLFSIVFIASFTAAITTSLTVGELQGKVRGFNDLDSARVGSISETEGADFLARRGIPVIGFDGLEAGLQALADGKIDAFVQNELILKYEAQTAFQGRVQVLPEVFDVYFVSLALPLGSPLRRPINLALLDYMQSPQWIELLKRYLS